jgi:hypothetical protein
MKKTFFAVAVCALSIASSQLYAGTIIKLTLGDDDAPDIEFSGGVGGILRTTDDSHVSGSTGDQNTAVEFLDVLDSQAADILTDTASFTLDGLLVDGPANVLGGFFVVQEFTGGTLSLYDAANTLLLSGTLNDSALAGVLGPPAAAGVITTTFGEFTGGTLAGFLDPDSLSLSISLANINDGAGLSVTSDVLNAFEADATAIIGADPVPEPGSVALLLIGGLFVTGSARFRRG